MIVSTVTRLVLISLQLLGVQTPEEFIFRLKLAAAIEKVTDNVHEQNVLMRIARWETNYIERLASPNCECRNHECDNGRARGTWQVIPYNDNEKARLCVSIEQDAALALERIRESERVCKHLPPEERLAVYARGRCTSKEGRRLSRVRWMP